MKKYLLALLLVAVPTLADDSYWYTAASIGHWFDGEYEDHFSYQPDGKMPVFISGGYAWEIGNWEYSLEGKHRSNLDLGWPVGPAGENEYHRNGFFGEVKYKFKD